MPMPSDTAVTAWIALHRAQTAGICVVENALKAAGLPRLEWYDVLLELERGGAMRPRDLQTRLLFAQYNLSRLLDRMTEAGVVVRQDCAEDRRGLLVSITPSGRELRRKMWAVYGPAIDRVIGPHLEGNEAEQLAQLLQKVAGPAA